MSKLKNGFAGVGLAVMLVLPASVALAADLSLSMTLEGSPAEVSKKCCQSEVVDLNKFLRTGLGLSVETRDREQRVPELLVEFVSASLSGHREATKAVCDLGEVSAGRAALARCFEKNAIVRIGGRGVVVNKVTSGEGWDQSWFTDERQDGERWMFGWFTPSCPEESTDALAIFARPASGKSETGFESIGIGFCLSQKD